MVYTTINYGLYHLTMVWEWFIPPIKMVYDTQITIVNGIYKPT